MNDIERITKQLQSVREAIEKIESGSQESHIESAGAVRKSRKANLADLYKRESELECKLSRLKGRGISYVEAYS